jgi:hypothetical protein
MSNPFAAYDVATTSNNTGATETEAEKEPEIPRNDYMEDARGKLDNKRAFWKALMGLNILREKEDGGFMKTNKTDPVNKGHNHWYKENESAWTSDDRPEIDTREYIETYPEPEYEPALVLSAERPNELNELIADQFGEEFGFTVDDLRPIQWNDDEGDIHMTEEGFKMLVAEVREHFEQLNHAAVEEIPVEHVRAILGIVGRAKGVGGKTAERMVEELEDAGFDL